MRKRIAIALAIIAAGAGAAGAVAAFTSSDEPEHAAKTCEEMMADPPEGAWTCYGPMPDMGWAGDPEHSVVVKK